MGVLVSEEEDYLYARNIYLLGTAEKGPVNVPVLGKSLAYIKTIFGSVGSLIDAYMMIEDSDIPCNVYLVKTAGSHAELYLNVINDGGEIIENGFYIKSRHASEDSNNIEVYLDDNVITFTYPFELGGNVLSYELNKYKTLHDLAASINEDTKLLNGEVFCSAFCEPHVSCEFTLSPVNPTDLKLVGGSSGLNYNKNMMYNSLSVTYSVLEGFPTDIIVPLECYFDDTFTDDLSYLDSYSFDKDYIMLKSNGEYLSFYKQLIDFCRLQMQSSIITHGVMGMCEMEEYDIDENKLIQRLNVFNKVNNLPQDYERYSHMVSVTSMDLYSMYGTIVTNSYVAYSVLLASTKISETTTNKNLPSSFVLYNVFEQEVLSEISKMGYVCFRNSPLTNNVHVVNGVTKSKDESLKYLCNVRASQIVMKNIRSGLSKYIGKNIDQLIESGDINQDMHSIMSNLNERGLIKGYSALNIVKKSDSHLMLDVSFSTKYMVEDLKSYTGLSSIGDITNGLQ